MPPSVRGDVIRLEHDATSLQLGDLRRDIRDGERHLRVRPRGRHGSARDREDAAGRRLVEHGTGAHGQRRQPEDVLVPRRGAGPRPRSAAWHGRGSWTASSNLPGAPGSTIAEPCHRRAPASPRPIARTRAGSSAPPTQGRAPGLPAGSIGGATTASSSSWTCAIGTASRRSSSTRSTPGRARGGQPDPPGVRGVRGRHRGDAAARHGEREAADGCGRAPGDRGGHPVRGEDAALLHQRAGRAGRRDPAPEVPLPRHPARADAAPADAPQPDGPGHPRGPSRQRLRRGRDAHADQEHARRRARLHRPEPAPARHRLRPAAEPAAAQAAADGRRHRPLHADRPVLPRRGPARRPPARVHPARPRDELRRRGRRDGLRRGDGHRGLARQRARPTAAPGAVPADDLRGSPRAVRLGQAGRPLRHGAGRPRERPRRAGRHAVVGLRRVRFGARGRRPGQGDRGARHGRRDPA